MKKQKYKCKKCGLEPIVIMDESLVLLAVECQDCGEKTAYLIK